MSKLRIQNFGPIKDGCLDNDGWIDIKKVTVFIGNQGSGKSTVAKVFSTLSWIEKAYNRGDIVRMSYSNFYDLFNYQGISNYFRNDTLLEYEGGSRRIIYDLKRHKWPVVEKIKSDVYNVPKIMYVPAERSFLSVIKNVFGIKNLPDTLYTFAEELRKGQQNLKGKTLQLPISKTKYKYDKQKDISLLIGNGYELDLTEASSGFQSFVPLYLVSKFLTDELSQGENKLREQLSVEQSLRRNKEIADIMLNEEFDQDEKVIKVKGVDRKYLNSCFINIVEEPELNLYPTSQRQILFSLLKLNNINENNKLVITTHSPYLINELALAIMANSLKGIVTNQQAAKISRIVPKGSEVGLNEHAIYQLDDKSGTIEKLKNYDGLPSDENQLNEKLEEGNEFFAKLLEIKQILE